MLVSSTYLNSIVARVYKVIRIWGLGGVTSLDERQIMFRKFECR